MVSKTFEHSKEKISIYYIAEHSDVVHGYSWQAQIVGSTRKQNISLLFLSYYVLTNSHKLNS
jgi:hypothetical protein